MNGSGSTIIPKSDCCRARSGASISAYIAEVVASPELNASLKQLYYRPETTTPEQFTKMLAVDLVRLGKVIKDAGMSAD